MQDNELKKTLEKLAIPAPSDEAKARAMQAAMQAFEKSRKGFTKETRLTHTTRKWDELRRSLTMKKAYVFAGSFAALAVILVITTTHYSAIMQPVLTATPQPAEAKRDVQAPVAALEKDKKEAVTLADSAVDKTAPGMSNAPAPTITAAAPPPPPAEMQALNAAPSNAAKMAARVDDSSGAGVRSSMAPPPPGISGESYYRPQPVMPGYSGGDKFEKFSANESKSVASEPVSTFSIDVDSASYSFVRRMINGGQLPQPEMVRTEEMINYFDYHYALPESKNEPFKPTVTVAPTPWNSNTKLVHIGIKAYDVTDKPRANLVFLIDVSGSMNQPDKLPLVKSSLKMLLDQMSPDDTIGIVTYAGYAGTALSPTKVADKQKIIAVIDQLGAGGGTAGGEGIRSAYELAQRNFNKNSVNRVILATDGDFNVGITDPAQLTKFIEEKRDTGISLSILGFGQGNYNDALMQKLAQNGNGNAAYIDTVNEARKALVHEASATLFTVAKDVKIQVEFNPAMVSTYRLIGYESRMLKREDFNNDKIDAGEVGAGHAVTAIYEITPVGSAGSVDALRYGASPIKEEKTTRANASGEYGFLKMRYKLPNESESKLISTPINGAVEVATIAQASDDVRFATAVAAFGQALKGSTYLSGYSMDNIAALADGARGADVYGYRSEFVQLVNTAKALSGYPQPGTGCTPVQPCE